LIRSVEPHPVYEIVHLSVIEKAGGNGNSDPRVHRGGKQSIESPVRQPDHADAVSINIPAGCKVSIQ